MNTAFLQPSWLQRVRIGLSQRAGFAAASLALLGAGLGLSWLAHSTSTAPAYPAIALSSTPLYATTPIDKPSLALALSVEYPTVGAQYTPGGSSDNTYSNATEYLGYYDAESCYTYNDSPSETPATGLSATDYKRFDRSGPATSRKCSNAFSGNFLNWASSSAIDMLRLALSGGDRYIDQDGLTILQRALIPNGDPICMWNSSNFPAKQLTKDGGGAGTYWGAVPTAMITAANGSDIYVANTLNRIYFGTSATGDCGSGPSSYVLNTPAANQAMGPITTTAIKICPVVRPIAPRKTELAASLAPWRSGMAQAPSGRLRLSKTGLDATTVCLATPTPAWVKVVTHGPTQAPGPRQPPPALSSTATAFSTHACRFATRAAALSPMCAITGCVRSTPAATTNPPA